MKKSKKTKNPNFKEIVDDMDSLLSLLGDLNKTKIEDLNLTKVNRELNIFEEKYKDFSEESEDNLDTKK